MNVYCESCRLLRPEAEDGICPQCGDFLVEEPAKTRPMASKRPDPFDDFSGPPAESATDEGSRIEAAGETEPLAVSPTTSSIHNLFVAGDGDPEVEESSPTHGETSDEDQGSGLGAREATQDATVKAGDPADRPPDTESAVDLDAAVPPIPPTQARPTGPVLEVPPIPAAATSKSRADEPDSDATDPDGSTQFDVDDLVRRAPALPAPNIVESAGPAYEAPRGAPHPDAGSSLDDDVSRRISERVQAGFSPFGFIGFPASGKTHFLKALQTLLDTHGVSGGKAADELDSAFLPAASQARVSVYPFASDYGKWLFLDAGGELYSGIKANDWNTLAAQKLELTRWLHRCKGLFLFLHVQRAHLDPREIHPGEHSTTGYPGADARATSKALEARQELRFFGQFLLFLRAVAAENGDVEKVVDLCRQSDDIQDALRSYRAGPKLKIPVMLFMTKADSYGPGFEIADGVQFYPRKMSTHPMIFAARWLPTVFRALLENVLRFKVDFLQSYVEFPETDAYGAPVLGRDGKKKTRVRWQASPQDPLSVGLTPALEFILRHPPDDLTGTWRDLMAGHGLDTRQALWLHRRLKPGAWQGVKVDLPLFPGRGKGP